MDKQEVAKQCILCFRKQKKRIRVGNSINQTHIHITRELDGRMSNSKSVTTVGIKYPGSAPSISGYLQMLDARQQSVKSRGQQVGGVTLPYLSHDCG